VSTAKQITANRKNASLSTGPKTPKGKARSSMNALKHGLMSRQVLLPDENKKDLEIFATKIRSVLAPIGEMELLLVDRIITAAWRLRRVLTVEAEVFAEERTPSFQYDGEKTKGEAFIHASNYSDAFSKLSRYEATIERSLYRALHELQRLQASREGQEIPAPAVLDVTMDSMME
jgi:hypothetical protein